MPNSRIEPQCLNGKVGKNSEKAKYKTQILYIPHVDRYLIGVDLQLYLALHHLISTSKAGDLNPPHEDSAAYLSLKAIRGGNTAKAGTPTRNAFTRPDG